jgi:transposase-like protein
MGTKRGKVHFYTPEERAALVTEIDRRYRAGEGSVKAISEQLGIAGSNYYNWLKVGIRPTRPPAPAVAARKYEPAERERLVAEIERLRDEGVPGKTACKQVGVSHTSYLEWRQTRPHPMRPVEVTALVPVAPTALTLAPPKAVVNAPVSLSLVAPGGYRIEGLAVDTAAALLRALS